LTIRDYSKFLSMITKGGYVGKKRVLSPVAWKWIMTSTCITDEGMRFYNQEGRRAQHTFQLPAAPLCPFFASVSKRDFSPEVVVFGPPS